MVFGPLLSSVIVSSVAILVSISCQERYTRNLNRTTKIRPAPTWPDLKEAFDLLDNIGNKSAPELINKTMSSINDQLDELLTRVQNFSKTRLTVGNSRTRTLVRAINSCDAAERECLLKIIGIPGLSKYYYHMVLSQLADHIGLKFHDSDIVMLKRMNAQPNFVDLPEHAYTNLSYPIFIKFSSESAKLAFLSRIKETLFEKQDPQYLNKLFQTTVSLDTMEGTEQKIQIHGFLTMSQQALYRMIDKLCLVINYSSWKQNMITLYQTRYTKHFDAAGEEQLQTEGIIIKLKSRALKFEWMRRTRMVMMKRPKHERKSGFSVNLGNHVKYRDRNFKVYIDEHLSTHKKNLFLIARARCNLNNWMHCWTWDGNIFVRKNFNSSTHRIDTFEGIDSLIK